MIAKLGKNGNYGKENPAWNSGVITFSDIFLIIRRPPLKKKVFVQNNFFWVSKSSFHFIL